MKLNHECVRDLLLTIENDSTSYITLSGLYNQNPPLQIHSYKDVLYTTRVLFTSEYNQGKDHSYADEMIIDLITYEGHKFLDNIRDQISWNQTVEKVSKIGSVALPIVAQIAWDITKARLGVT